VGEKSVDKTFPQGRAVPENSAHSTDTDSKPTIDFQYLTNNSSFQRGIMEFIKKFIPGFENVEARGSKEIMAKSFDINAQNYREIINELKSGESKLVKVGSLSDKEIGLKDEKELKEVLKKRKLK